jgi:hypothetical protein
MRKIIWSDLVYQLLVAAEVVVDRGKNKQEKKIGKKSHL